MILLKDGVKYLPYEYNSEEELTKMVTEHIKEIFGENTIYFTPKTMKTQAGIESRNDGIILTINKNVWYILEVELAKHSLSEHIIPQITKFSIAYEEPETRRKIVDALYNEIQADPLKTAIIKLLKVEDLHKMLTDLINIQPTITIIIDRKTPELDKICKKLPFPTKTVEFKTYVREKVGVEVHIHEFQPLFEEIPATTIEPTSAPRERLGKIPPEEFLKALKKVVERQGKPATSSQIAKELGLFEITRHPRDLVRREMRKLEKTRKVKIKLAPPGRREKYFYEPIN